MRISNTVLIGSWFVTAMVVLSSSAYATVTKWLDMSVRNGRITVATAISRIHGSAMFDTGAQINGVNSRFLTANSLDFKQGPKLHIRGIFSAEERRTDLKVPVDIFGTSIDFRDLVEVDVGPPDLQLIIGAGFFENFIQLPT